MTDHSAARLSSLIACEQVFKGHHLCWQRHWSGWRGRSAARSMLRWFVGPDAERIAPFSRHTDKINDVGHKANSRSEIAVYRWWTYLRKVAVNLSSWDPDLRQWRRRRRRVQTPPSPQVFKSSSHFQRNCSYFSRQQRSDWGEMEEFSKTCVINGSLKALAVLLKQNFHIIAFKKTSFRLHYMVSYSQSVPLFSFKCLWVKTITEVLLEIEKNPSA